MKTHVDELARSWSREDLTTVHNAVLQDPQQFSQLLATIISARDADVFVPAESFTEGTGHRDELVAPVKPIQLDVILRKKNKKPLRLLTGIPLSLGKQVQKAAWVYDAVNTIIGVYESAESSAATLSNKPQKMTLKSGNKVLAPTQDLLGLTGSKILCLEMHLGPAVLMPQEKKNDWKVGPATKDLSVERTHEVHANADQHCVLSGSFCFHGQAGHECAHIIPRACDTDALRKFVGAMSKIDTTFPLLTSLNDAGNIILVDIRQHRALDREAIAAYLPPPTRSPAPSDGLVTTVEWHHWPSDKPQTGHANHLDAWAKKINGLRDEGKSKEPGGPHKCDAHPAFASWYTATEPWTETAIFPHPTLLRLHYGVFLAHKFGSMELKSFAMGGKRRKGGGGGNDRGGHDSEDSEDNEDENLDTDGDGDADPEADEDQDHDGDDDDNIRGPGQDKGKGKRWSPGDAEAPPLPKRQATSYGDSRALSSPPVSGSTPSSHSIGGVAAASATSVNSDTPWKHLGSVAETDERSKAEFDGMAVEQVDEGMEVEVGVWGMGDTEVVEDDCCKEHEDENDEDKDDDGDEDDDNDNDDVNEIQDADEKHMRERVSFFHFIMELAIENTEALTT